MKSVLLIALLTLASCGKNGPVDCFNGCTGSDSVPPQTKFSLIGDAGNDPRLQGVELKLDLTKLNQDVPVQSLLGTSVCTKALGNNNATQDTGVTHNHFKVSSTDGGKTGTLQFSHLAYYEAGNNDQLCSLFSKEKYNFTFDGTTLTLFAIAPGKPWDGLANSFSK